MKWEKTNYVSEREKAQSADDYLTKLSLGVCVF